MDNTYIEQAVAELELHVAKREAFTRSRQTSEEEVAAYFKRQAPTVFPKVEYSPCVIVIDNR